MKKNIYINIIILFVTTIPLYSDTGKLDIIYTEWYPYTYEKNGEAAGFEINIVKSVLNKMGIDAEFHQYPWKRCLHIFKNGDADIIISVLKTPERDKYTFYSNTSISISRTVLFTKKGNNINYQGSFINLKDYSIGVVSGFSYGKAFDNMDYLKKEEVNNAKSLIKKIIHGRNDIGVENQIIISSLASQMEVEDQIQFIFPPVHTEELFVGFSKIRDLKELKEDFSTVLKEFQESESYKEILKKYGITNSK